MKLRSLLEAGKRHNATDQGMLQTMHDHAVSLGAECAGMAESLSDWVKGLSDDDAVELAEALEERSKPIIETSEGEEITSDLVPLTEAKAIGKDGIARVKVISPGHGSSGFYPAKTLETAAAKFANAQCFWDHPSATDETNRPERSLRDLAGKIVGVPTWEANGTTGPGIYADVQVFGPYRESVEELAPHIGMSIRAMGKAGTADVDGKKVRSIESIDDVRSVDFVTLPGRGGEILQLFESARTRETKPQESERKDDVDLTEATAKIAELETRNAAIDTELSRLREVNVVRDANAIVIETMAGFTMPESTRKRLTGTLAANPPLKEGAIDREAFVESITKAVTAELEYLAEASGVGVVRGMGGGDTKPTIPTLEESGKRIEAALASL